MTTDGYVHKTLDGRLLYSESLSDDERRVLTEVRRAYRYRPAWAKFTNFWREKVRALYRSVPAKDRTSRVVYLIGEDLEARLGVSQGYFRVPDYRDELRQLIAQNFRSTYAFSRATGLDQGFLSRLLHKSSHISVERLNRALLRIGWQLKLAKVRQQKQATLKGSKRRVLFAESSKQA